MEGLPHSGGFAIAASVSFHFTADALSPNPIQITPYHSKARRYLQSSQTACEYCFSLDPEIAGLTQIVYQKNS